MNMSKFTFAVAAAVMAACAALAETVEIDGRTWVYSVGSDGTATVSGVSPKDGDVSIPFTVNGYKVTSIGNYAFYYGGSGLTSVTMGNGVTNIGKGAFSDCSGLTSVTIGDNVSSVGDFAFDGCSGLTTVAIPNGVTSIGVYAFRGCDGLTSVTIGDNVRSVGDNAFDGCSGLTSVTIPSSVTSIGDSAFKGCSGLTSVTIGDNVTSIGLLAFYGCTAIRNVELNGGLANISGNFSDSYGSLTNVVLGAMVTGVGDGGFKGCSNLTAVVIPNGVTNIGVRAFEGCSGLTSVTIGDGVTNIGRWAFSGCSGLTSVEIPSSVMNIGDSAFWDCSGLKSVMIGDGVTNIGDYAFSGCSGLTSVTIGGGVTNIGRSAFCDCDGLTSVTIPASVTSIGGVAFRYCSSLKTINFMGDAPTIDRYSFPSCTVLYVQAETNGWDVDESGKWQGYEIVIPHKDVYGGGTEEPGGGTVAAGGISKFDIDAGYDGRGHTVDANAIKSAFDTAMNGGCTMSYALDDGSGANGSAGNPVSSWMASVPSFTNVGEHVVWYRVQNSQYEDFVHAAMVSIARRKVTLTSASAAKVYDGSPLVNGTVTVGGDGFVSGEGASFTVTGSQTAVGESANSFTYALNANTKAGNYNISALFGTLTVTKTMSDVGNVPTVGDLAASDVEGGLTISDLKVTSRAPWGIAIDYVVSGATEADTNAEPIVTATAGGRTYTAQNLFGATNCVNGVHRVYWDILKDGITGQVANGVVRVAYDNAPYCVIDLSGGTDAVFYPASYLASAPAGGWTDEYKTTKLVLRRIESGSFIMGSNQSLESHRVTISKPFYIGVFEVTQKQWELVMGTRPSYFTNSSYYASRPVECVSYKDIRGLSAGTNWPASSAVDATSFLGKLRAKTWFDGFDLPTEAQWEYACRAGTTSDYNNGGSTTNDLNTLGRYYYNGGRGCSEYCTTENGTAAVGSYLPNAWGLYDMHGNVYEWCLDWYGTLSYGADPVGSSSGSRRVKRGGGWSFVAGACTSSSRSDLYSHPSDRHEFLGFRLVRPLKQ